MKACFQKQEHDCGIACVAMLLGVDYETAFVLCEDVFFPGDGIYPEDMLALLKKHGIEGGSQGRVTRANPITSLVKDALIWGQLLPSRGEIKTATNVHNHWAVWDCCAQALRDPYGYRNPMRLSKFYEVVRPRP